MGDLPLWRRWRKRLGRKPINTKESHHTKAMGFRPRCLQCSAIKVMEHTELWVGLESGPPR
jgi:hypothetical protein